MKDNHLYGLDLLRIITAFAILSYHYFFIGPIQGFYDKVVFHSICFFGEFGVDIFFLISGFVILISTEYVKSAKDFLVARAIRIYPPFVLCSIFTMLCGFIMPDTNKYELFHRWLNSLTFYSDVWNGNYLSSIYWTLFVEVKFYILVALVIKLKIWKNYKYQILLFWTLISLIFSIKSQNSIFSIIFNLKYAGHFTLGIILYILMIKKERSVWILPISSISIWLIFKNMIGFTNWIRGLYQLSFSDFDILFCLACIITSFILLMKIKDICINKKLLIFLGNLSFTLYLIHADFGYFIRTQYYQKIICIAPTFVIRLINEHLIMITEIVCSVIVATLFLILSSKITKKIRLLKEK